MPTPATATLLAILLLLLPISPAIAEDPDEPEFTPEEKKAHDREVKQIYSELKREKNQNVVRARISRLGTEGTRANRDALMKFATGNKNHAMVKATFLALATIKDKKSIEFLCGKHALKSRNFLVQESAIGALGETRDGRAVEPLIEVMSNRRSKEAIIEACGYALTRCGPKEKNAELALLKGSTHSKSSIRIACLKGLGQTGTDRAYYRLTKALKKDTNTGARGAAATGLGELGNDAAIPLLRESLQKEGSEPVKSAIRTAIASLGG
jgi:HEAT repeat protein